MYSMFTDLHQTRILITAAMMDLGPTGQVSLKPTWTSEVLSFSLVSIKSLTVKRIMEIRSSQDRRLKVISSYFHDDINGARESSNDFKTTCDEEKVLIRKIVYHVRRNVCDCHTVVAASVFFHAV